MKMRIRLALASIVLVAATTALRPTRLAGQQAMPEPVAPADRTGFTSIFDGVSLKPWDGDPAVWRVEHGAIVGETTKERPLKANTFLIWRGGQPQDFELKLEYRISATNSGIQYRSREVPDAGKWVLAGYQADIDYENRYTGQLYDERGRGFLALRGQATLVPGSGQKPRVIGRLESADALAAQLRNPDWHQLHIIARSHTFVHVIDGHVTSVTLDEDVERRAATGLIGIQMHTGDPMKVELRNIALKTLPPTPAR